MSNKTAVIGSNLQLASQSTFRNNKIYKVFQSMVKRKLLWTINEWPKDPKFSKMTRGLLFRKDASFQCVERMTLTVIT